MMLFGRTRGFSEMQGMKRRQWTVVVGTVAIWLGWGSVSAGDLLWSDYCTSETVPVDGTVVDSSVLYVPSGANFWAWFDFTVSLTAGEVVFRVVDDAGEIFLEEAFSGSSQVGMTVDLPCGEGEYRFQREARGAVGSWSASARGDALYETSRFRLSCGGAFAPPANYGSHKIVFPKAPRTGWVKWSGETILSEGSVNVVVYDEDGGALYSRELGRQETSDRVRIREGSRVNVYWRDVFGGWDFEVEECKPPLTSPMMYLPLLAIVCVAVMTVLWWWRGYVFRRPTGQEEQARTDA